MLNNLTGNVALLEGDPTVGSQRSAVGVFACLVGVALIGLLDVSTGPEVTTFIFYCVPILLATSRSGVAGGSLVAAFSSVAWVAANLGNHPVTTELGFVWAAVSRMAVFGFVVLGGNALRLHSLAIARSMTAEARAEEMERQLLRIVSEERSRLGGEIARLLLPRIEETRLFIRDATAAAGASPADALREADRAGEELLKLGRDVASGLSAEVKAEESLESALSRLAPEWARITGMNIECVRLEMPAPLNKIIKNNLAIIVFESLRAAAHSGRARSARISTLLEEGDLTLRIEDDGDGYQVSFQQQVFRVAQLAAAQIGAQLSLHAVVPHGAMVHCRLPAGRLVAGQGA